jgi:hypothetical protein
MGKTSVFELYSTVCARRRGYSRAADFAGEILMRLYGTSKAA